MTPFITLRSRTAVLAANDVDTDQIIPARFLTTTTREGLGKHLFADWRYDSSGAPRADFVLNLPGSQGCRVLVAGRNFGCGSSREHAAWALLDHGFQVVIGSEFADIFRGNALKNGLLPVQVDDTCNRWLLERPGAEVTIDLSRTTLTLPDGTDVSFPIEPFAGYCLLNGVDELGFLLERGPQVAAYEQRAASAPSPAVPST